MGNRNRSAGNAWELKVIKLLEERSVYPEGAVVSCRSNSKRTDDLGVDLMHLDELTHGMMRDSVQCKTVAKHQDYVKLLREIAAAGRPGGVIFVRKTKPVGKTRRQDVDGLIAVTTVERYLDLMACERFVEVIRKMSRIQDGDEPADRVWCKNIQEELKKLKLCDHDSGGMPTTR